MIVRKNFALKKVVTENMIWKSILVKPQTPIQTTVASVILRSTHSVSNFSSLQLLSTIFITYWFQERLFNTSFTLIYDTFVSLKYCSGGETCTFGD